MTRVGLSVVALVLTGCFSPTDVGSQGDASGTSSGSTDPTTGPTDPSADPSTDPSTEPTTDPSGDPTTDPSGDPTGPTTTDDTTTDPDSSSTNDDSSPECPSPNVCVDPAPDGWSGPVVMFRGDVDGREPACALSYPIPELEAFGDLSVPAGDCGCDCMPPGDAFCDGGSVVYHSNSATCDLPSTTYFIEDGCADFGVEYFSIRYFAFDASTVQVFGSDCTPMPTENIPAPAHESIVVACGGPNEAGMCNGEQLCVPAPESPFQDRLCIWQDGDAECPAETGYTEKEVYYDSFTDERECSTCSCGALGGTCDASVTMRDNPDCAGAAGSVIDAGGCATAGIGAQSAELFATPDASCPAQGGELEGDVVQNGAHTICCTP